MESNYLNPPVSQSQDNKPNQDISDVENLNVQESFGSQELISTNMRYMPEDEEPNPKPPKPDFP